MNRHKKYGHREGFAWLWSGVIFLFKNWSVFASVGATLVLFGSTIIGGILIPAGQKIVFPFIRDPVRDMVIRYGKPILAHSDSICSNKFDSLRNEFHSLEKEFKKNHVGN